MLFAIVAGLLLMGVLYLWMRQDNNFLKGMPHPKETILLGSVFELKKMSSRPHLKLQEWANQLGDIYYFRVVSKRIVVLNSVDLIHEALVKKGKDFAGRIQSIRLSMIYGDKKGGLTDIGFHSPDDKWSTKRKVTQRSLKQFGEGMIRIQDLSLQFVSILIEKFKQHNGQPFNPTEDVYHVIAGMMYTLVLGIEIKDGTKYMETALEMERKVNDSISTNAAGLLLDELPFLRFFGNERYRTACETRKKSDQFFDTLLKEDNVLDQRPEGVHGVVDDLYQAQQENGKDIFSDECIYNIMRDLTSAGIGTTSPSFCSFINILAANMQVQKAMQQEIENVLGDRTLPTLADRDTLPYCRAALLELLRYVAVVPLLLPHTTICDTDIAGYKIKKDTVVLMNVWAAHHNEHYWGDPEVFRPERFLDETGQLVPPDHPSRRGVLAFGAGARICLEEILAINRMFLFVVSLLRNFDLLPDPECEAAQSFDPKKLEMITVLLPQEYKIIANWKR